ncbi:MULTISPECIES: tyrosine-type recombinase/integrase [Mycobacterium avium complex (MAC)]|uniref:tyrosine-type recombinase/integrase n=1 Tax=Mycobacterium avium complex (MAC) TaxID=120793 RepID=UPI001CF1080E|nr:MULTISPECIES: integrase [Mycobacterium avium complex (MAC)]UCN12712.1 integrase [Mycobacterium intracellulare subsp. chimaera]
MTEVLAIQNERVPRTRLLEVINDMDLLDNDVELPIHQWIKQSVNAFPPGFREPIKKWLTSLCCGGKRERPRSKELMQRYFGAVRPFIYDWSQQYGTLREVTRSDVQLVLDPLQGFQLQNAVVALRSLFRFAKKTGIVFINPATHLRAPKPAFNPLPLTDAEIRAVEQVAQASPEIKLVVALAVEHGARIGAIRPLTFEDVDLPNRRIVLAGHTQRLGDLSQQAMLTWLQHRRVKWPHSPNRHILITGRSAPETRPVSRSYFRKGLWPKGFKFDPIRQDRILHEALTASPDPLHLSMIFGITHATAMRYVRSAQALLAADDELDTKDDQ